MNGEEEEDRAYLFDSKRQKTLRSTNTGHPNAIFTGETEGWPHLAPYRIYDGYVSVKNSTVRPIGGAVLCREFQV